MRLLVVGAGATGGYFGGRLALAGREVSFLVRPARADFLRRHGLQIVSRSGEESVAPELVAAGERRDPADLVLLAVKAYSLPAALEDMASQIGPHTMILPVLNGWRHVEAIRQRFGHAAVVGGVCRISATLDSEGRIQQLSKMHDLVYGELDGSASARVGALDDFMRQAGFDARTSRTIDADMWEKWVTLATFGAANCLMGGTIGEIGSQPEGERFLLAVLDEAIAIASAAGRPPRAEFEASTRAQLAQRQSPMTTSMYRDLVSGKAVESEEIVGDLIAQGTALGVPAPLLQLAFIRLSVHQKRIAAHA